MEAGPKPFFVADSALYSAENVASLSEKLLWVTRVPATLSHVKQLVEETEFESTPEAQKKAEYGFYEVSASYGGVEQRGVVVFSPAAYQRERATLQKRIAQERARAEKQLWHLRNQTFADPQGAQDAGKRLEDTWAYHRLVLNVQAVPRYRTKGRPKAGAVPDYIAWSIDGQLDEDATQIEQSQKTLGKFVLATNQLDGKVLPGEKMLAAYKSQASSVERGFRFLKDPLFFASGLFLKKPAHIMALLTIMGLSLLVYALAERKLRTQLREKKEFVPNHRGKPIQTPR